MSPGLLNDEYIFHGTRQCHVQRVNVKLVDLMRFVGFVLSARVGQLVNQQVVAGHPLTHRVIFGGVFGDKVVEDHILILKSLQLLHGEEQRCLKQLPCLCLIFVSQHQHGIFDRLAGLLSQVGHRIPHLFNENGIPFHRRIGSEQVIALLIDGAESGILDFEQPVGQGGDGLTVAVIGTKYLHFVLYQVAPVKHALQVRPGKEIGVHHLVRITTEDEVGRIIQ